MTFEERLAMTAVRMADPQPGNRFEEYYDYWADVLARDGDWVFWRKSYAARITVSTVEEFRKHHSYRRHPGYWVTYYDDGAETCAVPADETERGRWIAGLIADRMRELAGGSLTCSAL